MDSLPATRLFFRKTNSERRTKDVARQIKYYARGSGAIWCNDQIALSERLIPVRSRTGGQRTLSRDFCQGFR